jgi:hypothetical protein
MAIPLSDQWDPIDILAYLFPECDRLGIVIPPDMPLDTPEHQRAACYLLRSAITARYNGRRHWLDGLR